MQNFKILSAIGFCLTLLFILNIGVVIAMVTTGDHLFAVYAIGLSAYQYYLHGKLSPTKKDLHSVERKPFQSAEAA